MTNLLLRPNPSSGIPIYLQLVDQVKDALAAGVLQAGDTLPAARPLAEALVISPTAVARAYRELEIEGIVQAAAGPAPILGTFAGAVRPGSAGNLRPISHLALRPTALALENRRLTAIVASDAAERRRWAVELETARQVQQRLFPQGRPAFAGLECAGTCRAALAVGGDYYDFLALSGDRMGIAIGDVCGKGPGAALLMATLRAYLHAQTANGAHDLPALMARLNRLVYDSSSTDRFASFFYAEYDAPSRRLDYVNAGHPPALVFRARDGYANPVRLDVGGPVIGMMPGCSYTQGTVTLETGDLLAAVTDGITEAMNALDEEWGDEHLVAVIHAHADRPVDDIVRAVMYHADAFAAGAPQHDDMTMVAVRIA